MTLEKILKELKKQNKQWDEIIRGKCEPNPNPKLHPGKCIQNLLEQTYHHPKFPQELDKRCEDLREEVTAATPEFPSLELVCISTSKKAIKHISDFLKRVHKLRIPKELNEQPKLHDEAPMSPADLARYFGVDKNILRKRLERLRKKNHNCFIENPDRTSREAQFLYKVKYVRPIIAKMKKQR